MFILQRIAKNRPSTKHDRTEKTTIKQESSKSRCAHSDRSVNFFRVTNYRMSKQMKREQAKRNAIGKLFVKMLSDWWRAGILFCIFMNLLQLAIFEVNNKLGTKWLFQQQFSQLICGSSNSFSVFVFLSKVIWTKNQNQKNYIYCEHM